MGGQLTPDDLGYPDATLTPAQFESHVVETLRQIHPYVDDLDVALHDVVEGIDGTYDLDGTVQFSTMGMSFLVVVEVKHHSHPIKRELVQVLNQKVSSIGAHKGLMVSRSKFQSGAVAFAQTHGVALVHATTPSADWVTRNDDSSFDANTAILQQVDLTSFRVLSEHPASVWDLVGPSAGSL